MRESREHLKQQVRECVHWMQVCAAGAAIAAPAGSGWPWRGVCCGAAHVCQRHALLRTALRHAQTSLRPPAALAQILELAKAKGYKLTAAATA